VPPSAPVKGRALRLCQHLDLAQRRPAREPPSAEGGAAQLVVATPGEVGRQPQDEAAGGRSDRRGATGEATHSASGTSAGGGSAAPARTESAWTPTPLTCGGADVLVVDASGQRRVTVVRAAARVHQRVGSLAAAPTGGSELAWVLPPPVCGGWVAALTPPPVHDSEAAALPLSPEGCGESAGVVAVPAGGGDLLWSGQPPSCDGSSSAAVAAAPAGGGLSPSLSPPAGGAAPPETPSTAESDGAGDAACGRTGASVGGAGGRASLTLPNG